MKTLLFLTLVMSATAAFCAESTEKPQAKCFGYELIQVSSQTADTSYVMRPVDGNTINNGNDIPVLYQSTPDLDTYTAELPSGPKLILTRSFEIGADMKGVLVYRGHFEWQGQETNPAVCEAL